MRGVPTAETYAHLVIILGVCPRVSLACVEWVLGCAGSTAFGAIRRAEDAGVLHCIERGRPWVRAQYERTGAHAGALARLVEDRSPPVEAALRSRERTERRARAWADASALARAVADDMAQPCRECGATKPADAFHRDPRTSTGLTSRCRECWHRGLRERAAIPTPKPARRRRAA